LNADLDNPSEISRKLFRERSQLGRMHMEKENQGLEESDMKHFFNQYGDEIPTGKLNGRLIQIPTNLKKQYPNSFPSL